PVGGDILAGGQEVGPGVAGHGALGGPHHLELAVVLNFTDQHRLGDVVVRHHRRVAAGEVGDHHADHGVGHRVGVGGAVLLHRIDPHVEADVVGFHGVVGDPILVLDEGLPGFDEGVVGVILDAHEVVPGRVVTDQGSGVDAGEFLLAHGEGDHGNIRGRNALVAQLHVERHVGVAVDGGHHR